MDEWVISFHTALEMVLCPSCHFMIGETEAERGKVSTQTWPVYKANEGLWPHLRQGSQVWRQQLGAQGLGGGGPCELLSPPLH